MNNFLLYKTRDIFNQGPLSFVIGSVEFMNSMDGGIGGDVDVTVDDNDKEEKIIIQ
jgi:hypothetical protein